MAAGQGRRFGGSKLLADVGGKPMLEHAIQLGQSLRPDRLQVITGAWHEDILEANMLGRISNARFVKNENWSSGLGDSIALAVKVLPEGIDSLLILLADQIAITQDDISRLIQAKGGQHIVCSAYAGRRGVPAVFDRTTFESLADLSGDQGAKALLYDPKFNLTEVALPAAEYDIDTPEALLQFKANQGRQ